MKLSKEQIKEIATGINYVSEEEGVLRLHRFTQEQEEYYKGYDADFYNKTSATAGVKFRFKTDSRKLSLSVVTSPASRRKFFSIDVFVNGEMIVCLDNYAGVEIPKNYVWSSVLEKLTVSQGLSLQGIRGSDSRINRWLQKESAGEAKENLEHGQREAKKQMKW